VLTRLLRQDLGFDGLVVTDALVMEAIAARHGAGEAAVLALEAGADLVLMPADPWQAIEAIASAVRKGRLSEERLWSSLQRRRRALERTWNDPGLDSLDPGDPLGPLSNGPVEEDRALAHDLLTLTLERQGGTVRRPAEGRGLALVRVDGQLGCPFLPPSAPALTLARAGGFQPWVLDGQSPPGWTQAGDSDARPEPPWSRAGWHQEPVLLQLFVRGNPFRGSAGGGEPWAAWIRELVEQKRLAGLVIYGSPYLWHSLRGLLPPDLPAVWSPGQMPEAQALVLDQMGLGQMESAGGFTD
jgi:beta-glucosidase